MSYDLIVLGTGGVGSSSLYHAAERGLKVLGLDRFPPGHDRGSSHGETRMIRQSYFEHPNYVPLLRSAYQLWDELAERRGEGLFHRCGVLYFGTPESGLIRGVEGSAETHGIAIERLSPSEARSRFPGFRAGENQVAVFEPDAGYLRVEDCIRAYLGEAIRLGAEHRHGETVLRWESDGDGIAVVTDREIYRTAQLVITAGCWTNQFLGELGIPLPVVRKHLHWFDADSGDYEESNGCPGFAFDLNGNCFYGFPVSSPDGLKVAEHTGGTEIKDPLEDERKPEEEDSRRIEDFLQNHLPGVSARRNRHDVCFYTMSPDGDYLIDRHPENANVAFAAGLSGHGFKCASAIGETLVQMVSGEETSSDVGFLGLSRF